MKTKTETTKAGQSAAKLESGAIRECPSCGYSLQNGPSSRHSPYCQFNSEPSAWQINHKLEFERF